MTEGTWLSLDVSPDGREIVFDLLGDIYIMPIEGGDATPLTSGIAWDMQPRFSPDGARIAFTSDRGGGDNIWIIDRDGSNPRQVTKENFRLLNSPAWSPDGDYIVARKHFTSTRSLGAGEMWLYHVSGGGGVQMTKRRTQQKDSGEPAFSPCGRYLYFSDDSTPGDTFEYSRDSTGQIYTIKRLDREKGEVTDFVTGAGGAVRPTPSPDGTRLAFVRRSQFRTCLYLMDLASGAVTQIHDGLERDMQETWAVHGVYPSMAWTPDNASIVFWAGGKIRRIDVESREVSEIPFRVRGTRRVAEALRVPQEVHPPEFAVKMLRWPEVSPDGSRVAYQALGHIYIRDLPSGEPRRLTAQTDHFEFCPSFSRDGERIVYTTWNDEEMGSVRIAPAAGGEGRAITGRPGHYIDPVFTPDGSRVVYGAASGGYLTSPLWARDNTGVFVVPAAGGEPALVSKKGVKPHFAAASDRVYLTTFDWGPEGAPSTLFSIGLDGKEERTHLKSGNATEYRVSPDGRWAAFAERYNVYMIPFIPAGLPLDVGPSMTALPCARVTSEAGASLHWSGDSAALHWTLGPDLYTRPLTDAFDFLRSPRGAGFQPARDDPAPVEDGAHRAVSDPPDSAPTSLHIAFTTPSDTPTGSLALVGGRIVTMGPGPLSDAWVIDDGVIIIESNRITAVGRMGEVEIPAGAHILDTSGHTILPGFIDVHAHGPQTTGDGLTPQQNWASLANLAFGVTTIHDPSHGTESIFSSAELARAGLIVAPRTFSTGTILYGAAGNFKSEIDSLDDARFHLRRMQKAGAFSVKSYNQPRRDQRQQVLQAARELGMMVVPEGGSLFQHNLTMIVDGHTGIEHSLPVESVYEDVLQLWRGNECGYTPTLGVAYGGIMGEHYWYQHTNVWENERLRGFVPPFFLDPRSRRRTMAPDDDYNHLRSSRIAKRLIDAGGRVQIGAHGQLAGLAAHWEVWMFVQGGMTPLEALRAATIDGAFYVGLDRDLGSIEPGKLADLIVLEKNPLDDIRNSDSVRYTILNGRPYDARTMNELGNRPRERKPFFWNGGLGGVMGGSWGLGGCQGCTIPNCLPAAAPESGEHPRRGYH